MFGTTKGRLLIILAVTIASLAVLFTKPIKFGLDLQGGTLLSMEIDDPRGTLSADQRSTAIDNNIEILRNRIDKFGVAEAPVQKVGNDRVTIQLPGIKDPERAKQIITKPAVLEWKLVRKSSELGAAMPRIDRAVSDLIKSGAIRNVALPADTGKSVALAGDTAKKDTAATQKSVQDLLFGKDTASAGDSLTAKGDTTKQDSLVAGDGSFRRYLQVAGEGEFLVKQTDVALVNRMLPDSQPTVAAALPRNTTLVWGNDTIAQGGELFRPLYFLSSEPFITGESLVRATAGRDPQFNKTIVTFELNRRGGNKFYDVTSANIGNRIAIVLDNKVFSAPVVNGAIGQSGQIEMGNSPLEDAQDLSLVLNAGAFSAPLKFVEERSVEASLGKQSIQQGLWAGILGLLFVVGIMVYVYRFSGFLSIIALVIYVLVVLAGLALIGAALTAPGIAGLILSVGMALDSNILIFERIREELQHGKSIRLSSDEGFKHAMAAIIDTHLTTLITAFILYKIGTGPVQGFATTLAIGLLASFFSAVYVTRTFFMVYLERRRGAETISI